MARARRRERHAVFKHQWILDVAVQAEPVSFQIGPVRAGREQVYGDVMRTVAGDGKIEPLGKPRNLLKDVTPPQLVTSGSG